MEDDISAFLAAGADIVLTKPLRFDTLQTLLLFIASCGNKSDPTIKYKLKGDHFEQIGRSNKSSTHVTEYLTI